MLVLARVEGLDQSAGVTTNARRQREWVRVLVEYRLSISSWERRSIGDFISYYYILIVWLELCIFHQEIWLWLLVNGFIYLQK